MDLFLDRYGCFVIPLFVRAFISVACWTAYFTFFRHLHTDRSASFCFLRPPAAHPLLRLFQYITSPYLLFSFPAWTQLRA